MYVHCSGQLEALQFSKHSSTDYSREATAFPEPASSSLSTPPPNQPEYYYANQDYHSAVTGTLRLKRGQKVSLLEASNEKWWLVERVPDSENEEPSSAGLVPPRLLDFHPPSAVGSPDLEDQEVKAVDPVESTEQVRLREKPELQQLSSIAAVMPSNLFGDRCKGTPEHQQDELCVPLPAPEEEKSSVEEEEAEAEASPRQSPRLSPPTFFSGDMDVAEVINHQADEDESSPSELTKWSAAQSTEQDETDYVASQTYSSHVPGSGPVRCWSLPSLLEEYKTDESIKPGSISFLHGRPRMFLFKKGSTCLP